MNINRSFWFGYYLGVANAKRAVSFLISGMLLPITILFLFYMISGGSLLKYAILGGFISIVAANGLSTMFDAAQMRLDLKFQDLFVASKMQPLEYMFGLGLSNIIYSIPEIVIYILIAAAFSVFTLNSFIWSMLVLLPLMVATTSIGFIVSYIPSHFRNIYGVYGVISVLFSFIPPIFYPYSILPKYLLYLFVISPATPASVLIQNIAGLQPFSATSYIMLAILAIETVFLCIVAARFIKWREP